MNVYLENNTEQNRWWVRMDDWRVGFNTAAEAGQFVQRLNARLNAPHSRDMLLDWSPRPVAQTRADFRCAKEA
ncbi:hypothetical protein A3L25_015685 [Pseudomonas putida]|uniref:Uncharacterized protein n=1 Tax=Pseudomonas putida TaxID=303 RepID=A0AAP9N0I8_PSEPU|nr:hypothetical protein [Pseudomonas putida]QJQ10785.1 hypothetical protein A3L25_015685 [Pseudomonas putida]